MAYSITDLRRFVRKNARNAMSSSMYTDQDIDDSYFLAAFEWTRIVRPNRTLTSLQLSVGSSAIPAFPATWTPDNTMQVDLVLSGSILWPGIQFVSMDQLFVERAKWSTGLPGTSLPQARPCFMAVPDATTATTTGQIDTLADQAYIIKLWAWTAFVPWTSGGTPSAGLGFTDEQVQIIASSGAPYYLQRFESENAAMARDSMYASFILNANRFRGMNTGGRGGQITDKDDPNCYEGRRITEVIA